MYQIWRKANLRMVEQRLPVVSVVVPLFNMESFILQTLESVASVQYEAVELIVVNDGSTDRGGNLAKEFIAACEMRALYISQPNRGEANAVNRGIVASSGEYLLVLSADDLIHPSIFQKVVPLLEEREEISVVYPDWGIIDENGILVLEKEVRDFSRKHLIGELVCLPGPGSVIRLSALSGAPLRDPRFNLMSDYEAWLRLSLNSYFQRVPEVLAFWRQHEGGTTHKFVRSVEWSGQLLEVLRVFFARPDLSWAVRMHQRSAFSRAWMIHASRHGGFMRFWFLAHSFLLSPVPLTSVLTKRLSKLLPI